MSTPTVVLVHGAFADSTSWDGVVERLSAAGVPTLANAVPLRSLSGDATYLHDTLAAIDGPVVVVAHSYGGMVATQAAAGVPGVVGIVYVAAFAPDTGESAIDLSGRFPGSTLGDALVPTPLSDGGQDLAIRHDLFHGQFVADVDAPTAALMAVAQRPVTAAALGEPLTTADPAWRSVPSWFVYGELDQNIPAETVRFLAERAGSRGTTEIPGASHALSVSRPDAVAKVVLDAVQAVSRAAA
ncbi:alpha/beta fold hydrolase [Cellulosimicrobium arenosum]|uniref:Alpha/beta hydrolase n=1 Tax=Cellulosimicrobium arenosum TaxID=2708133 RepID=A0A927G9G0_9MICO|nr:alpha/beta hydrolase [Cellulosimicrobium arenosum]MBD8079024.1 alpha/beta hydrolase [Cellulosimicrobium arenosum]